MARRWSAEDDRLLARLYDEQLPINQIAIRVGRSPDAVVARRRTLGIAMRRPSRPWSSREEALLRAAAAAEVPASALAVRLGRSPDQVRRRRRALVTPLAPARPYSSEDDEAVRVCLLDHGNLAELAGRLGRSPDGVRLRAQHLGLYHPRGRRRWTDWEDAMIRDGYTSALPCTEIARQLPDRSAASVAARARKLGLVTYARRWRTSDDQHLAQLAAQRATLEDVALKLGRTPEAIRRRAARLGIEALKPVPADRRAHRWTSQEDELLGLHHALNPARLAQLLSRSDAAVCRRLSSLGLRQHAARSPHHPVSRASGQPTPGERVVIERELNGINGNLARRRIALTRRLEYFHDARLPPAAA